MKDSLTPGVAYTKILYWHLKERGTRADGSLEHWDTPYFARLVFGLKEPDPEKIRTFSNWINVKRNAPPKSHHVAARIQRILFFDEQKQAWNPDLIRYADELWAARKGYYGERIGDDGYMDEVPLDSLEAKTSAHAAVQQEGEAASLDECPSSQHLAQIAA